jgi:hypothetical protein
MVFPCNYSKRLLGIKDYMAQRFCDGVLVELGGGGVLSHTLNIKYVIQTIAEAVTGIKYQFVLYKA